MTARFYEWPEVFPLWSWALTLIGAACFILVGRKVWWAWYVGIANQVLWLAYSLVTAQYGLLLGVVLYSVVYVDNQRRWSHQHRAARPLRTKVLVDDPGDYGDEPLDDAIRNYVGPPVVLHSHSVKTSCLPGCPAYGKD